MPSSSSSLTAATTTLLEISLQYASLEHDMPQGMYVLPSPKNPLLWNGVLFVHMGYYAGAILRFHIDFPTDFPMQGPQVFMDTEAFHPLVSPHTRKLTINDFIRVPRDTTVFDLLQAIKRMFLNREIDKLKEEDASHVAAHNLLHDQPTSFTAIAQQTAELSRRDSVLYDHHEHSATSARLLRQPSNSGREGIKFQQMDEMTLANMRAKLGLKAWKTDIDWDAE